MLKERLGGAQQQLLDLQGRSIRYSILKREVDTNRQLYDGLLQRLKEISVVGGVGINNISVVDKAQVPIYPYKPDLGGNLSTGLTIGLLVGLLVAWLLEHLDDARVTQARQRVVFALEQHRHASVQHAHVRRHCGYVPHALSRGAYQ